MTRTNRSIALPRQVSPDTRARLDAGTRVQELRKPVEGIEDLKRDIGGVGRGPPRRARREQYEGRRRLT